MSPDTVFRDLHLSLHQVLRVPESLLTADRCMLRAPQPIEQILAIHRVVLYLCAHIRTDLIQLPGAPLGFKAQQLTWPLSVAFAR